jgi:hypothetical protein
MFFMKLFLIPEQKSPAVYSFKFGRKKCHLSLRIFLQKLPEISRKKLKKLNVNKKFCTLKFREILQDTIPGFHDFF